MRAVNQAGQKVLRSLTEGLTKDDPSRKLGTAGDAYMPVCIELVGGCAMGQIFSVAHYYEQNGDLMADPEMTFLKGQDGEFYAISYRQDGLGIDQPSVEFGDDGEISGVRTKLQAEHAVFAGIWCRNIKHQQNI